MEDRKKELGAQIEKRLDQIDEEEKEVRWYWPVIYPLAFAITPFYDGWGWEDTSKIGYAFSGFWMGIAVYFCVQTFNKNEPHKRRIKALREDAIRLKRLYDLE